MTRELLVVAGEPSGDRMASLVLGAVGRWSVHRWGMGGPLSRAAGLETIADCAPLAAMGIADVARRLPRFALAARALLQRAARRPPDAALLVNFTELNLLLGRALRAMGTRVLWCAAPQVWAWRRRRMRALRRAADRLAVILPFEEPLWRSEGVAATYVGHPSLESGADIPRPSVRDDSLRLAVLPGSRAGEIARVAPNLCSAAGILVRERIVAEATVLRAPWLDSLSRARLERTASANGLSVTDGDPERGAAPLVGAFDVAISASGTACLETALAAVPTVVAYRLDPIAWAIARRLSTTHFAALPKVLLDRRAQPELLQEDASPRAIAAAVRSIARDPRRAERASDLAHELRCLLAPRGDGHAEAGFGARVAVLLSDWLAPEAPRPGAPLKRARAA